MWAGLRKSNQLSAVPQGWRREVGKGRGQLLALEGHSQITVTQQGGSWEKAMPSFPSKFWSSHRCLPLVNPTTSRRPGKPTDTGISKGDRPRAWRRVQLTLMTNLDFNLMRNGKPLGDFLTRGVTWSDVCFEDITWAAMWRLDCRRLRWRQAAIRRPMAAPQPLPSGIQSLQTGSWPSLMW